MEEYTPLPSTLDRAEPPEPSPTCASPPTSSTALAEVWDFLKQAEEQRQADREADQVHREECFATLAQVVIKEKLGKASDVLYLRQETTTTTSLIP